MFNANYSMMNANYSHMRGIPRRNIYVNESYGQFGGRGQNVGRCMFFASYPRGFPNGSSITSGFGRGNIVGLARNQSIQPHRSPHVRNLFSLANNSTILVNLMNQYLYAKYVTSKVTLPMLAGIGIVIPIFPHLNNLVEIK